jgi:hypothetical protein
MARPERFELEPFSRRERSGSLLAKSRAQSRDRKKMVRPERFELPTFWFVARRSIQLS